MIKLAPVAFVATLALFSVAPAALHAESSQSVQAAVGTAAPVDVKVGKSLYGPDGKRIASVYRVTDAGQVQIILQGKLVNVPVSSLSEVDGKIATTSTKSELVRAAR